MSAKRDRLQVIHDILYVISQKNGSIRPTHILYKANLSQKMMDDYLGDLIAKGFVEEKPQKRGKTYSITQKGFDYLNEYKFITQFVDRFGLD
jgi:predicted transcriptional regulator